MKRTTRQLVFDLLDKEGLLPATEIAKRLGIIRGTACSARGRWKKVRSAQPKIDREKVALIRDLLQAGTDYVLAEISAERKFRDTRCGSSYHDLGQLHGYLDKLLREDEPTRKEWSKYIIDYKENTSKIIALMERN
ncbi:hypothetical protein LCGC14_0787770 [marine sediment metagenome]|uniref:Uncharacterized protein n=1 Tax=marine sediment metagenome TaxID=412755 RepID=A0A0F9T0N0_9ZZZZ